MKNIGFHHSVLADPYEKQAREQGYTFGVKADWVQRVGFGLVAAYIHGCITDAEYDRIIGRFHNKILVKNLKPLMEDPEK